MLEESTKKTVKVERDWWEGVKEIADRSKSQEP